MCVRGEREREEAEEAREKREAAIRMKITKGECAGDGNEGKERWGSVKHEVHTFERSKWKEEG